MVRHVLDGDVACSCKDEEEDPGADKEEDKHSDVKVIEVSSSGVVQRIQALLRKHELVVVEFLHTFLSLLAANFQKSLEILVLSEEQQENKQETDTGQDDEHQHDIYALIQRVNTQTYR